MRTSRFQILSVLLAFAIVLIGGCYYDQVITPDVGEVVGEVSFTADIIPIFDKDCNSSGCHNAGGQKPDLSAANAFTALANGNYINIPTPEESELYLWMRGLKSVPMPPSGPNAGNNAKVLAWIKQGALQN